MATGYFFVITPLQYLCALEAKHHFCGELKYNNLIIFTVFLPALSQLSNIVHTCDWDAIDYLPKTTKRNKYFDFIADYYKHKLLLNSIINKIGNDDFVFIGNVGDLWLYWLLANLKCRNKIIIDDGMATINHIEGGKIQFRRGKRLRNIIEERLLNLPKSLNTSSISYFSLFSKLDFYQVNYIRNNFSYVRLTYGRHFYQKTREAFFVGQHLVDLGVINLNAYIDIVNTIKKYYQEKGYTFQYCKHRTENASQLPADWNVHTFDYPIEVQMLRQSSLPCIIVGFYSSALLNLKLLFPKQMDIVSVRLPDHIIDKRYLYGIKNAYEYYAKEIDSQFIVRDVNSFLLCNSSHNCIF